MSQEALRPDGGRLGREFLAAFNEIEQHLRRALQRSRGVPLSGFYGVSETATSAHTSS